jgi:ATP/maltotriose-dependent transcriptional regulator MalT
VEVLQLIAAGRTALAVSHHLRISVRTVHKHLEHIYDKLGCRDRLVAVQRSRQLGLIAPDVAMLGPVASKARMAQSMDA